MRAIVRAYRDAFSGLPREIWWLAAVLLVNRAGAMVVPFLALYLTRERGFSLETAGAFVGLYGLGATLGVAVGGRLTDRLGPKPVQMTSLLASGALLIALGFARQPWTIAVGIFVLSVFAEAFRPANSTAVATAAGPSQRARAFGLQRLAINLGFTIGPALGGVLAETDYRLLFPVDGGTALLAAVVLGCALPGAAPPTRAERDKAARDGSSPWRDGLFLAALGLNFLKALVFFQLQSTFAIYLREEAGFGEALIGRMLAVNTVLIVFVEMLLVRRLEGRNPLRLIALSALLIGLGYGLLALGTSPSWVAFTVVVWTVGEMLSSPTMAALVADRSAQANRGRYMGVFGMSLSMASLAAPILGTRTYASFGPRALWGGCLAVGLAASLGFLALDRRGRRRSTRT